MQYYTMIAGEPDEIQLICKKSDNSRSNNETFKVVMSTVESRTPFKILWIGRVTSVYVDRLGA